MENIKHHTDIPTKDGLPLYENWGSFNIYSDGDTFIVTDWREDLSIIRLSGLHAEETATKLAYELHQTHDIR